MEGGDVAPSAHGAYVEHADYVSSHAYDEAKERELFEAFAMERFLGLTRSEIRDYYYADTQCAWLGWQACAKSRARSAE